MPKQRQAMELADTLQALISALQPPTDSGLSVSSAEVEAPLALRLINDSGRLCLEILPTTVMHTGIEPVVHRLRLCAGPLPEVGGAQAGAGDHDG